ncbi:hypothetical protein HGA91_00475 [candidate division WWE3 bacterium]|nr:hypothetical protein [candidate division WWE3 bacterium]
MANKNGFSAIEILAIILIISLVAGGIYVLNSNRENDDTVIPTPTQPITTTSPSATVAPTDEYSNWETYTNPTYGFSFKYPKDEIFISENTQHYSGKDIQITIISKDFDSQIQNGVDLPTAAIGHIDIFSTLDKTLFAHQFWNSPKDFFNTLQSLPLNQPEILDSDLDISFVEYTKQSEGILQNRPVITLSAKPTKKSATDGYSSYFTYILDADRLIVLSDQPNTDPEHNLSLFKRIATSFTFSN